MNFIRCPLKDLGYQMAEYRERLGIKIPATTAAPKTEAIYQASKFAYEDLAGYYGLSADMEIGQNHQTQTEEEEFNSYSTAALSPLGTDMVKWWEVRDTHCQSLLVF